MGWSYLCDFQFLVRKRQNCFLKWIKKFTLVVFWISPSLSNLYVRYGTSLDWDDYCNPCPKYTQTLSTASQREEDCICIPGAIYEGSTFNCSLCDVNTYSNQDSNICVPCQPNTYSTKGSASIDDCSSKINKYCFLFYS